MFKRPIQLPTTNVQTVSAGGFAGIYDDLSPASRSLQQLSDAVNVYHSGGTAIRTRPGRQSIGDVGAGRSLGLAAFYPSSGANRLVSGAGGTWQAWDGAVWSPIATGLTPGMPFEAVTFNNSLIISNGADAMKTWTGTGNVTDLDAGAPKAKFLTTGYKRIFAAGVQGNPHLVYVSDIARANVWINTANPPTDADTAAISVNDKDGDEIKAVRMYQSQVVVWKRRSVHEINGPELGRLTSQWRVSAIGSPGTVNGRTIVEIGGRMYWLSDQGVVAWSGAIPRVISQPVQALIRRINWSAIDVAAAGHDGEGRYMLSLPLDGATNPTYVLVYDTNDDSWWVWNGWQACEFGSYRTGSDGRDTPLIGDTSGEVFTLGGTSDNGNGISWSVVIGPSTVGAQPANVRLRRVSVIASGAAGGNFWVAASTHDTDSFPGTYRHYDCNPDVSRMRVLVPIAQGESGTGTTVKVKLWGGGDVTIHDVSLDLAAVSHDAE